MNKNEKQFKVDKVTYYDDGAFWQRKGIPPSVIFTPLTYRKYIETAKQLYLLNLQAVEDYIQLDNPPFHQFRELYDCLIRFHCLCVELMNQDFQHGYYRPDALDDRRLLGWMTATGELSKKLSAKVRILEEGAYEN